MTDTPLTMERDANATRDALKSSIIALAFRAFGAETAECREKAISEMFEACRACREDDAVRAEEHLRQKESAKLAKRDAYLKGAHVPRDPAKIHGEHIHTFFNAIGQWGISLDEALSVTVAHHPAFAAALRKAHTVHIEKETAAGRELRGKALREEQAEAKRQRIEAEKALREEKMKRLEAERKTARIERLALERKRHEIIMSAISTGELVPVAETREQKIVNSQRRSNKGVVHIETGAGR